jgi:hypothetical protein
MLCQLFLSLRDNESAVEWNEMRSDVLFSMTIGIFSLFGHHQRIKTPTMERKGKEDTTTKKRHNQ